MTITTVTSRKILPTTLAAALAGLLMVSGCTKQAKEDTDSTANTQTAVQDTTAADTTKLSAVDQAYTDRLMISYANQTLMRQKRRIKPRASRIRKLRFSVLMKAL